MEFLLLPLFVMAVIILPLVLIHQRNKKGSLKSRKGAIVLNLVAFFGAMAVFTILPLGGFVSAEATDAVQQATNNSDGMRYLAAAISTGLGSIGTGIAVATAASAAIGATSEDEKNFTKSLIFVALGEGVAIYGLLISILILFA